MTLTQIMLSFMSKSLWLSAQDMLEICKQTDPHFTSENIPVFLKKSFDKGVLVRRLKLGGGKSRLHHVYQYRLKD